MRRAGVTLTILAVAALAAPPAEGVPSGSRCAESFGDPKVTECIEIRGNTPYVLMTNESGQELCGELKHVLTTTQYNGRTDNWEKKRYSGCLKPGQSWEESYSPIDAAQQHKDCTTDPCREVDYYRSMCAQGFQDGKAVTRYVCR
jgi:hypothetical protein